MKENTVGFSINHPCFNPCSDSARIHLPVAPKCDIQCNFCLRKFDCCNESRPGVTSDVLSPEQALARYRTCKREIPELRVVGIAGPGDPLSNWEPVSRTLALIREFDKDVILCLSTNGLHLPAHVRELAALGVEYLTVTVNALTPRIGAEIYHHIHDGTRMLTGEEGFRLLLARQLEGIALAAELGMHVKINTVVIPGVNESEPEWISRKGRELGAVMGNLIPLIPVPGTPFSEKHPPDQQQLLQMRQICGQYLPQMLHCNRCRADACGKLKRLHCREG